MIKFANKHPRVNILQPGCGVGGHYITVDPYFIAADYPLESQIIGKAREINNYKSFWCAEKVKTDKLEFQLKHGRKSIVALMGLAFKPNIDDLRESPAKYIVQKKLYKTQIMMSILLLNLILKPTTFSNLPIIKKLLKKQVSWCF